MIEEGQRSIGGERGEPERQPCELNRRRIAIHAVEAALRDRPAEAGAGPASISSDEATPSDSSARS